MGDPAFRPKLTEMFPKDLVVFLEPHEQGCGPRLAYAAALAKRWSAHLIGTFVTRPLVLEPHADFAMGPALTDLLAEHRDRTIADVAHARAQFDQIADSGFTTEWRVAEDGPGELLMFHARHASLAILGPPARQHRRTTLLGLSERIILGSGRPSLMLPEAWPAERLPRRIVIGWNGGREATRAIADAMPFLVAADSVHLMVVLEERTKALFGQDPGADMAAHLARQGIQVSLEQRSDSDASGILLKHCAGMDADLLVMGAMGRPRISEVVFGGVTRSVFGAATLPVLISG